MSCGDESWIWFRHYFTLCKKCGSVIDAETKYCEHCEYTKSQDE